MKIKNQVLLITGGTGSFGTAVLNRFLDSDHFNEIRMWIQTLALRNFKFRTENILTVKN